MASFVAMERHGTEGERDVEFVRDGFHLLAFLFPLFWFLFYRMWIEAAVTLALIVGFAVVTSLAGFPVHWPLSLIVSIFAGLEAPALRLASMRRAGWRDRGVIEADDAFGAEERYIAEGGLAGETGEAEADADGEIPTGRPVPSAPRPAQGPALGLFSYPGGR